MAPRKKTRRPRAARAKAHESQHEHDDDDVTVTIGIIGPLVRIKKGKRRRARKATPKEVKSFLKWVLTQL